MRLLQKKLGCNWDFHYPHNWSSFSSSPNENSKKIQAALVHGPGMVTRHISSLHSPDLSLIIPKGTTNCGSGEISARTNPHNMILKYNKDEKTYSLITGSGQETCFKRTSHKKNTRQTYVEDVERGIVEPGLTIYEEFSKYTPLYDKKSNGNIFFFKKDGIEAKNSAKTLCYGWINYERNDKNALKVMTSDGKKGEYFFEKIACNLNKCNSNKEKNLKYKSCLTKATFNHKPSVDYEYTTNRDIPFLSSRKSPEGRFQTVEYYNQGLNHLHGLTKIKVDSKNDYRIDRIKAILRPVGVDQTPIVTHQFIYETSNSEVWSKGKTIVYDAYLRKTVYEYNKDHRPISISRYKDDWIYSSEKFIWDDTYTYKSSTSNSKERLFSKQKRKNGNLIGKYIQRKDQTISSARFFDYDDRGNIVRERFYGNLTGTNTNQILLDEHQQPKENGIDCAQKFFTYTDDRFNLLLSEKEENGKEVHYCYLPNTDLITAKYTTNNGVIQFREFYHYDQNGSLIRFVKDDGSKRKEDKLNQVTERHIIVNHMRQSAPFGLPEITEHYYWDFNQGEVLQKRILLDYSKEGYLTKQEHYDAQGNYAYSLFWEYDSHGNLTKETNAIGQIVTKEYDENDNLIVENGFGVIKRFYYDFSNRLIREENIQASGETFAISHRYDYIGNRVSTIDRFGNETRFEYDSFNRLIKTHYPCIQDHEGRVIAPIAMISYDCSDRPVLFTDPKGLRTKISYNALGKPTRVIHPSGYIEKNEYDLQNQLIKTISKTGLQTKYTRDFLGRVVTEEYFDKEGNSLGNKTYQYKGWQIISQTDCEGTITRFKYDGAGRVIQENYGDACKTFEYDSLGRLAKSIDWHGFCPTDKIVKVYFYDPLNRIIEENIEDGEGNNLNRTYYEYDERGNVRKKWCNTNAGENFILVEYNTEDKPLSQTNSEGQVTYITYNYHHINPLGQKVLQIIETDALGRNTYKTHDAAGRLREEKFYNAFGQLLSQHEIHYDASGRQIQTADAVIIEGKIERVYTNTWSYHSSGQPEKIIEAAGTPEQKITYYQYDAFGQKRKEVKPDGIELKYMYDVQGKLALLSSSDKTISYAFFYDRNQRLTEAYDCLNSTTTKCSYDSNGRIIEEKLANDLSLKYQYDRSGRPVKIEFPDQSAVNYVYHSLYLREVQRIKNNSSGYTHKYLNYDQSGVLLDSCLINHAGKIHYEYDRLSRLIKIGHTARTQTAAYDILGRLDSMDIQDNAGTLHCPFDYNEMDHVVRENDHTYQTDSLHNRIQKNNENYSINPLNQITQKSGLDYHYDLSGNLIKRRKNDQEFHYHYDALNRLKKVIADKNIIEYEYDALNRRIAKFINGKKIRYIYQGQNEIGCISPEGSIIEMRILGHIGKGEIGSAIAFELNDRTYAPLYDLQGNVSALLDENGLAVETYRYTAFGEETIYNESGEKIDHSKAGNPWRFSSKRVDPETQWVYFGMRYYDPVDGRWTTKDPAFFADGPNLYAYLHHSPLTSCDVYGLCEETIAFNESVKAAEMAGHFSVLLKSTPVEQYFNERNFPGENANYEKNKSIGNIGFVHGITKDLDFQAPQGFKEVPWSPKERIFFCGSKKSSGLTIISGNGIMNTSKDAKDMMDGISKIAGDHEVTHIYNRSTGFFLTDLIRCFFELFFNAETEAVRNLKESIRAAYYSNPGGMILNFCHSEEAIVTRNALRRLPNFIRQHVIVIAFAPGAYIEDKYAFHVTHYVSTRDIVPYCDFIGRMKCKDSTVILKPHPDAPWLDHGWSSETYRDVKEKQINYYTKIFGGI